MSRLTDALEKLRTKCTEAGTSPAGDSIDEIVDCIAEHFDVNGEDGADGVSVTAIALTTTEGAVTGGTVTFSDGTTAPITVTESGD